LPSAIVWSHVVACGLSGEIGAKGAMPWHIPEDLKFFRKLTTGNTIVMGRKTFESIGKPLPNRRNIVLTNRRDWHCDGVEVFHSLADVRRSIDREFRETGGERKRVFIIGGGELYRQSFPWIEEVFLTTISNHFPTADTFYPIRELQHAEGWGHQKLAEGISPEGALVVWNLYSKKTD
jgi:dihydrofolate reductase